MRDVFAKLLAVESKTGNRVDLKQILKYPVTDVPMALAHSDGTMFKTEKSSLTRLLEERQGCVITDASLPAINATIVDGGCVLHKIIVRCNQSTYSTIAKDLLVKICSLKGKEVHLTFDQYSRPSIKDQERNRRGTRTDSFVISGPEQVQSENGKDLVKNQSFKDQFSMFVMTEWKKIEYSQVIGDRVLFVSHGGNCLRYANSENGFEIDAPEQFQGRHEEADTLIALHAKQLCEKSLLVRSSDTDVLIILIALVCRLSAQNVIVDFGHGNTRRFISVSGIVETLNKTSPGLTIALLGFHALTGCDYTSSFNRKGKIQPFKRLESQHEYIPALFSLSTNEVDVNGVTKFVASLYRCDTSDIDDARYTSFIRMTMGNSDKIVD